VQAIAEREHGRRPLAGDVEAVGIVVDGRSRLADAVLASTSLCPAVVSGSTSWVMISTIWVRSRSAARGCECFRDESAQPVVLLAVESEDVLVGPVAQRA
jgi:hypothetical protein